MRVSLEEIRVRTYKPRDAWWTVLLVDPLASRLVRLVAPYRWITPNVLTVIATILGLLAAACFAGATRWWLVAGAALFHVSFVVDCMDGKIARLNGTGSLFGAWFDFVFDRLKAFVCALGLFGGQYQATGRPVFLWLLAVVIFLDLFRYLNGSQVGKVRLEMREKLDEARGRLATDEEELARLSAGSTSRKRKVGEWLRVRRIRTHLFSGIEYEMFVFIVAPLTGLIISVSVASGVLLLFFEFWLVAKLYQETRGFGAKLAAAEAEGAARTAGAATPVNVH